MGSLLMKDWGAIRSTSWWREKGGARQEMEREIEGVGGGGHSTSCPFPRAWEYMN